MTLLRRAVVVGGDDCFTLDSGCITCVGDFIANCADSENEAILAPALPDAAKNITADKRPELSRVDLRSRNIFLPSLRD
ncbi:MAG TPA: hypothetical protein V6C91_17770 [Coleofasciculaceae cyanobacterium]